MKSHYILVLIIAIVFSCKTSDKNLSNQQDSTSVVNDTIRISGDNLEYDIIIIDPGYNRWVLTRAKPKGFHSQSYLENKNIRYVMEWNRRVLNSNYGRDLYELTIDYRQGVDYGYDVNYTLYNYFVYFQNSYNQNLLGGRIPID